jgi:Tfp pilus assembly PilM family ATPase
LTLLAKWTTRSSIGLDIDDHEFRAVQLVREQDTIRASAWAVFPRLGNDRASSDESFGLPGEEELEWASSILSRRGFKGTSITCAPRTRDCTQHVFELPPPESGAPLDQLARVEIERARKCAPNDFEMGYWSLPQRGRTSETMAVVCPRRIVDSMISTYASVGLDTVGIDLAEVAITRGASEQLSCNSSGGEPMIDTVLHLGWGSALAIVTLGDRIVYVRRVARGVSDVWDQATNRYGLSTQSARAIIGDFDTPEHDAQLDKVRSGCWNALSKEIASELDVAVAYVSHSFRMVPLGRIIMSGFGAQNTSLRTQIDNTLGIPLVGVAPKALQEAIPSSSQGDLPSRLAFAYGLAARFDA